MYKQSYLARAGAAMTAALSMMTPGIIQTIPVSKPIAAERPILSGGGRHKWPGNPISPRIAMRRKSHSRRVHAKAKTRRIAA